MSEVNYKVWRWSDDSGEGETVDKKYEKKDEVIQFMKDVRSQGYTTLQPFFELVGSVNYNPEYSNDTLFFRASLMYYKAIPNERDILRFRNYSRETSIVEQLEEHIEDHSHTTVWFIDNPAYMFTNTLDRLGEHLKIYLNAGFEVINNTLTRIDNRLHEDDYKQKDSMDTLFEVYLQKTASAQKIIAPVLAEEKRRAEEQRLRMEKEEGNRQARVVEEATSMFEPNVNRGLKYKNLQKAGNRSRRKRTQRKHRKTRHTKRS